MLTLADFFHLDEVDDHLDLVLEAAPGLIIVAGLDPRPTLLPPEVAAGPGFLPSGRSTIARIVLREMLAAQPDLRGIVIAQDEAMIRSARRLRDQVEVWPVQPPYTYPSRIAEAVRHLANESCGVLILDRLCSESAPAALEAAQNGLCVIAELDTVFRGANVARHLLDLGVTRDQLDGLACVITVQRLPTLCTCKHTAIPDSVDLLRQRYSELIEDDCACFEASGCADCQHTGYYGDVIAFDILHAQTPFRLAQPSQLPMEAYVVELALLGYVSPEDALQFEAGQFHRTYNLLLASERALSESNVQLERKLVELEAAYSVLEQRTEALFSLQAIGQALIGSTELDDLAEKVCHRARDLCGADRAILYVLRSEKEAEVLAAVGWPADLRHQKLDAEQVFKPWSSTEPESYTRWPPGITPGHPDVAGFRLKAGLYVPLMAQDQPVGVMIVHSTRRSQFTPGQIALLQTFANQAALAIQREATQADIVQKERLEHELELARDVQQSVLPRTFPVVPGYEFAARYESARMVGGDFYDVIALDDDQFGLVIADVSDKGIPAALYMALTRSLLLAEAHRSRSPSDVLTNVNRLLLDLGEPNMFVTVFYGVVDRASRRLTYTRAGHDRPLVLRDGDVIELGGRGTMLGLLDPDMIRLSEELITLAPGDRLILYTDGLTDVMAPDGRLFTREQLIALLQDHAARSPDDLCTAVLRDLADYRRDADQFDDTTLLVVGVA